MANEILVRNGSELASVMLRRAKTAASHAAKMAVLDAAINGYCNSHPDVATVIRAAFRANFADGDATDDA